MTKVTEPVFDFAGSCPSKDDDHSDEQLIALTDKELAGMIRQNFEWQWETSGGRLEYVSPGDAGKLKDWLRIPAAIELRERLGLEPHDGREYCKYIDRLRSARGITAEKIGDLGYERLMRIAWQVFVEFRQQDEARKNLKLRFGIATPYSWAFLAGIQYGSMNGFVTAVANEVKNVLALVPKDEVKNLLISFESPIEQVVIALASAAGFGNKVARMFAKQMERVVEQVGSFFYVGLHPCWGDLNNKAVIEVILPWVVKKLRLGRLLTPNVQRRFINHLQSPKNLCRHIKPLQKVLAERLKVVLLPLSAGSDLPSTDPASYRPLRKLSTKNDISYIAGICHADQGDQRALEVASAVMSGSGLTFSGFGPRCGLARTPCAEQIIKQAMRLCDYFKNGQ